MRPLSRDEQDLTAVAVVAILQRITTAVSARGPRGDLHHDPAWRLLWDRWARREDGMIRHCEKEGCDRLTYAYPVCTRCRRAHQRRRAA